MNPFSFFLFKNVSILPSFLKDVFTIYRIALIVSFFQHFKSISSFSPSLNSFWKEFYCDFYLCTSIMWWGYFSCCFKNVLIIFYFQHSAYVISRIIIFFFFFAFVASVCLYIFGVLCVSWICGLLSFINFLKLFLDCYHFKYVCLHIYFSLFCHVIYKYTYH